MRKFVRLTLAAFAGVCLFTFCCINQSQALDRAPERITVAMAKDSPPFYFLDENGVPTGWLVELWQAWSERTGIKMEFLPGTFPESLEMIKSGKADAHIGLFFSKPRTTFVDYSCPLIKADTSIFYHRNLYGINSASDLKGIVVGVVKGDFAEGYLIKANSDIRVTAFKDKDAMFAAARKGSIKALVVDTLIGVYSLKKEKLDHLFKYNPGQPLYSSEFFAAVKKGAPKLASLVKEGFAGLDEKQRTAIAGKWSGAFLKDSKDVVTIAADRDFPPFTWLTDAGRPAGILVDLWRLWSTKTGKRIEFVFGDRPETYEFMKDGRAMIHSGLFRDKKRSQYLNYSLQLIPVEVDLFYRPKDGKPDLQNMKGKRIGMLFGSGYEALLDKKIPSARFVGFENFNDMLPALAQGRIDGVVDVGISIAFALRAMGMSGLIERYPEPLAVKNLYAGVAKGDPQTLALVSRGLGEIPKEVMIEMEGHWVPDPEMRMYKKLASILNLTAEEKDWLAKHKIIRLGVDRAYLPFEGMDSSGRYLGISSDYIALLNKKLGVGMLPVGESGRQKTLQAAREGEVDVIPCISPTGEMRKHLVFTRPYKTYPNVVVTKSDRPLAAGLKGLKEARVAVIGESAVQEYIQKHYPDISVVPVDGVEEGLRAVKEDTAAAYVGTLPSITYYLNKTGLKGLKVSATTEIMHRLSFGVRKDWPQLQAILEKALQSISEEEHEKIVSRWANLQVSRETDWQMIFTVGAVSALALGIILAVIITWNRRMAREVAERKVAEERFSNMAANVPGAIFQVEIKPDGERKWLYLSRQAEQFFGAPLEKIINENLHFTYHPEDKQRMLQGIEQSFKDRKEHNLVGRILLPGGEVRWIRIKASPTPAGHGVIHYNGFILDITPRKLAEQEYLATERKIKAMSQAVEDALIMIDADGKVLFWNPAAERLFGYSENEAKGMDFHNMAAPEEYHELIRPGLERFKRTGEGVVLGTTTEITARNRKGEHFPVEVTLSAFELEGECYAVGTVRDITERKLAEKAIKESEQRVRTIIDSVSTGIIIIDPGDHTIVDANNTAVDMIGIGREKIIGSECHNFVCPKQVNDCPITDHGETIDHSERVLLTAKGLEVPVLKTVLPVMFGEKEYLLESFVDISDRKKAEEELKDSRTRLSQIFDFLPDATMVIDNDGHIIAWNKAMEELTGVRADDMLGVGDYRYAVPFYGEVRPVLIDLVCNWDDSFNEKYMSIERLEGGVLRTESFHPGVKGGMFISATARILYDSEGRPSGAIETMRDITGQKRAEDALKESGKYMKKILETTRDGFWFIDNEGYTLDVNQAMCGILARPREDVLGKHASEFYDEKNLCILKKQIALRDQLEETSYEISLSRPDGSQVLCLFNATPFLDDTGRKTGSFAMVSDITEKKRAEAALKESEERSRLILASAGEGIFGVDTKGRIGFINPTALEMLGFAEEEVHGKKVHDLIHHTKTDGSHYSLDDCPMFDAYTTGVAHQVGDEVLWRKNGECFPVEYSSTPIMKEDRLMGAVITFRDVSERLEAERELKENLDELERFSRLVVGRELKMIGLKEEINGLLSEAGRDEKYKIVE